MANCCSCQRCIRASIFILLFFCVVQIITATLKYVYTVNIAKAQVFEVVMDALLDSNDVDDVKGLLRLIGLTLAGITVVGFLCTCLALFCVKCCNKPLNGCCTKLQVFLTFVVQAGILSMWFLLGAILIIPYQLGPKFVEDNCKLAVEGRYDEIKVNGQDASRPFKLFVEFDEVYSKNVNGFMCTDFCICPGLPTDAHYKAYKDVDPETYKKYGRTFSAGFNGTIELQARPAGTPKPMFWAFDPST